MRISNAAWMALFASALAAPALAEEDDLSKQIEEALKPTQPAPSATMPSSTPRGVQSMNPDISAIADATGGYGRRAPLRLSGDDPDLGGSPTQRAAGFTLQELEIGVQSVVDPYLRADLFLTIPNQSGIEVEEGYATSTGLPGGLQVKGGIFRSAIGRQNGQHLHVQDFTRRPLINAAYLGVDGLRSPGLQLSWLVPLPFYLTLAAEAFSVAPPDGLEQISSFGGGKRTELTYAVELKTFAPLAESLSLALGLNGATGVTAGVLGASPPPDPATGEIGPAPVQFQGSRTLLGGADAYFKWKPANVAGGYFSLAWQTEYFLRRIASSPDGALDAQVDGGLYTQLVLQFARRWLLGLRFDALGLPASEVQARVTRESMSLTFTPSEFARVRVYGEREDPREKIGMAFPVNYMALLQLEVAIGAHGAHPF